MATSRSGGSTQNGRDSRGRRLGCKHFGGEFVNAGAILIRQRGTKFHPGVGVRRGNDDTLYTTVSGLVQFHKGFKRRTHVSVVPQI